jgi:hypothetical protein
LSGGLGSAPLCRGYIVTSTFIVIVNPDIIRPLSGCDVITPLSGIIDS